MTDPHPKTGEIEVPAWAALLVYLVCCPLGIYLLLKEQSGEGRLSVMLVGVLIFTLPIAGVKPWDLIATLLGGRRR